MLYLTRYNLKHNFMIKKIIFIVIIFIFAGVLITYITAPLAIESLKKKQSDSVDMVSTMLLKNLQAQAEIHFFENDMSYSDLCLSAQFGEIVTASSFISNEIGCVTEDNLYAISVPLASGGHTCIDIAGSTLTVPNKVSTSMCAASINSELSSSQSIDPLWIEFESQDNSFSVSLPTTPTQTSKTDIKTHNELLTLNYNEYRTADSTGAYTVIETVYNGNPAFSDKESALDDLLASFLASLPIATKEVTNQKKFTFQNRPAIEFEITIPGERFKGYIILADYNEFYTVYYAYSPSNFVVDDYQQFIQSFTMTNLTND